MIRFENVYKFYDEQTVLRNFSYSFEEGKTYFIQGESGGGKTTFLRLLLGLEKTDKGVISGLEGKSFSVVFQENRLLEDLTVSRNVRLPIKLHSESEKKEFLHNLELELLDLGLPAACMGQKVRTLSGGMKRRVAILRALLTEADIYVFDEACQGLDAENKKKTMDAIIRHTKGKTVFWVTHNSEEIQYFSNVKVLKMA